MKLFLSNIHVLALGMGVALAGPALAAPLFVPGQPTAEPEVIRVLDSSAPFKRKDHDDGWKKRRHHHREGRELRDRDRDRVHDHDGRWRAHDDDDRGRQFRPNATPKYAYDAYGNLRVYDSDGWEKRKWDHRDGWRHGDDDWKKRKHGPRIYNFRDYEARESFSTLDDILTAVPD